MNFDKRALVGFITEIEASRDRAKGETRHQSEIFKKAREKGFEPKAMRQVLQRRAMKSADRERMDELLDLYEHAMGALAQAVEAVEGGMSAREAAERFGVPRGSLGAVVSGAKNAISEPVNHDAETGEIIAPKPEDGDDGITEGAASQGSLRSPDTPREDAVASPSKPVPDGEVGTGTHTEPVDCVDGNECHDVRCHLEGCRLKSATDFEAPATPSVAWYAETPASECAEIRRAVGAVAAEPRVAAPFLGDDPGPPPEFLRRTPEQGRGRT